MSWQQIAKRDYSIVIMGNAIFKRHSVPALCVASSHTYGATTFASALSQTLAISNGSITLHFLLSNKITRPTNTSTNKDSNKQRVLMIFVYFDGIN